MRDYAGDDDTQETQEGDDELTLLDSDAPTIATAADIRAAARRRQQWKEHATGVRWDDGRTRYVLATRRDGHIQNETNGFGYRILTSHYPKYISL